MSVLLITGGNEGIGYFMAKEWLALGNRVSVLDLHSENIDLLKELYPDALLTFVCDVRDMLAVKAAVDQTVDQFGSIQYAVHNACICSFNGFESLDTEDFHPVMDVNFYGAVHLAKAVLPIMKAQKQGKICFTSSGVGVTGYINISPYACSKGAIESLAKCLRNEYADLGITFHIMHPPLTNTKSSSPLPVPKEFKALPEKVGKGFIRHIDSRKFIITPSFADAVSVKLSYLFPCLWAKCLYK